jgi:chromosome segregation ATPase
VSLFQQECTPLSGAHLQDWRERLRSELQNQGYYQRDLIVRSVAQICHDLESRCQTVEEPLRREKEKSGRWEQEANELRQKLESVELKIWEDGEHITALDSENERLEKEKDQVADQLERLKRDFEDANTEAERTLREAQEQHKTTEAQLRSTILVSEDSVRDREQEAQQLHSTVATQGKEIIKLRSIILDRENDVHASEQDIQELHRIEETLSEKLNQSIEESRALNRNYNILEAQLNEKDRLLQSECEKTSSLKHRMNELEGEGAELNSHLQDRKAELATVTARLDDLQKRHHELAQSSSEALENLEKQFEKEMDATESKAAAERSRLNDSLQDALRNGREATEACENLQQEFEELQDTVPRLEAKIQELSNACLGQDEELERLRAWKNRVMASMGLPPEPSRPVSTNESRDPRTPRQHRRRKSALQAQDVVHKAPVATQFISNAVTESTANVSFTSSDSHSSQNGSTPKRLKQRASFKVPTMHTPHSNRPLFVSKSVSKRSALQPISLNRRHTTAGVAIPENEEEPKSPQALPLRKRRGSLQGAEQEDFDVDEFMAGTPFTPGAFTSGTGRLPEDEASITEL